MDGDKVSYSEYRGINKYVEPQDYKRYTHHIGKNPYTPEIRNNTYSIDIQELLWRIGYSIYDNSFKNEVINDISFPECNFDPIIIKDGQ